ncbi:hypothetical protein BK004_03155 [bacterium CG10_46_32]|nr:MAG: hypothetical protein BK004_03155 [bacterium CG10_46_32]PIR55996.1 MAG: endonuclease III [Parcubacteria group bacterium CG10_big_fil_rev_8_21_14_0_10_46_32]
MTPKKLQERKQRAAKIVVVLKKIFSHARMALNYHSTWELLVAVVLSAQCTDKRVNMVTKDLFKKYKKLDDYVAADLRAFEQDIQSTGFYKNKATYILAAANMVKKDFNGHVPDTMEEILRIPGVARKTANVVLGNAFGKVEGIAVDTHVRRFALKFNLTDSRDPQKIEQDLIVILPKKEWFNWTYRMIEYGREVCPGHTHDCTDHPLSKIYPKAATTWPRAK